MSSDGWVKRSNAAVVAPGELAPTDLVQYVLLGDDRVYGPAEARTLLWGAGPGPDGEGWIKSYRKVATVPVMPAKHAHYFKDVAHLTKVDVYRMLELFDVANPSIAHAIKKLLVAGGRGAGKDISQDVQEAIDSLQRWQEMRAEDATSRRS